jgi:hypothetical protein
MARKQGRHLTPKARKFANIQCSPTSGLTCRWLHLCLKQRPNAKVTKLEPLHVCKDDEQKDLTDSSFFKALRRAWKMQRTWTDLILFKLARIEFIKVRYHIFLPEFSLNPAPNRTPAPKHAPYQNTLKTRTSTTTKCAISTPNRFRLTRQWP